MTEATYDTRLELLLFIVNLLWLSQALATTPHCMRSELQKKNALGHRD